MEELLILTRWYLRVSGSITFWAVKEVSGKTSCPASLAVNFASHGSSHHRRLVRRSPEAGSTCWFSTSSSRGDLNLEDMLNAASPVTRLFTWLLILQLPVMPPDIYLLRDPVAMVLYAVVVSVCAPVWEEIVFRGFLLPSLTRYMRVWCAILVSSVAFALVHFNDVAVGVPWSGFGFVPFDVVAFA
ncbi:hypothetical protein F2Q70_00005633 [Brassica cretica]|uniref:CAAX prenyl protease 2/Lysostaphin resistance protein A-like domain-containing protein n=1 Tax=Brassica cretica TaxID=69181 RepID=A0A8S9IZ39_BRACR|nr:hypothetical protein F2Q70_00005633 [Brassica cretica]